jgi:hypothetical protein
VGPSALHVLAQRVVATLSAENEAGVGTLMQFRNVLESVRFEQAPGAAESRKSRPKAPACLGA